MPRRKRIPIKPLPERNQAWAQAGLPSVAADRLPDEKAPLWPQLLGQWFDWLHQQPPKRAEDMYCFIYYDIENEVVQNFYTNFKSLTKKLPASLRSAVEEAAKIYVKRR